MRRRFLYVFISFILLQVAFAKAIGEKIDDERVKEFLENLSGK